MPRDTSWVDAHFLQFYSGIDISGVPPQESAEEGSTVELELAVEPHRLLELAQDLTAHLRGKSGYALKDSVRAALRSNPEYFLVFAHLYRQKKFTAAELVHFFFEGARSDDIAYFRQIEATDAGFREMANRARHADWLRGPTRDSLPTADLAAYKKTIDSYLGSELGSWELWKSRILNDPGTTIRISDYLVDREHLSEALESGAFVELLKHTMRGSSSEDTKLDIGAWNARRVEEEIRQAGFQQPPCGHRKHAELRELESCLNGTPDGAWYERELRSAEFDRQFDFALANKGGVKFVIETNYYTSAGSKIDKTVKDFKNLEPRLRTRFPLIYVTDGIGWLGLLSLIRELIYVNRDRAGIGLPFYYNLRQFRSFLPTLKSRVMSTGPPTP